MKQTKIRVRDPEGTRSAVLDTAQRLFSEKGFAGTSMRELSRASGISQPLIHHHFGSKEGLYRALKQRLTSTAFEAVLARENAPNSEADVAGVVCRFFAFLRENRDLLRLAAWSLLEGETNLWPGEEDVIRLAIDQLHQAQVKGLIRKDIDPLLLMMMVEALTFFWCQNRSYYQILFKESVDNLDQRYLEQMLEVLFHGIATSGEKE